MGSSKKRCDECSNTVKGNQTLCSTCSSRKWRTENPVQYAYQTLKDNCKRRNIEFELTFAEFARFAYEEDYIVGKGKTKTSYSIDRLDETMGYFIGNIQVLYLGDNTRKENRRRFKKLEYDWETKHAFVVRHKEPVAEGDDPF